MTNLSKAEFWYALSFLSFFPLLLFFFFSFSLNLLVASSCVLTCFIALLSWREGSALIKIRKNESEQAQEKQEERAQALFDSLNELRVEKFQLSLLYEEARAEKQQEEELHQELARLSQVKRQYQEKAEALVQARRELFEKEGQLLSLQKEQEEALAEENQAEKLLIAHLKTAIEERQALEGQVEALQALVTDLLHKKESKITSKKKKAAEQLSIF